MKSATKTDLYYSWSLDEIYELDLMPAWIAPESLRRHDPAIYFLIDRQCVVYIGETIDLPARLKSHARTKRFSSVVAYDAPRDRADRRALEDQLIMALHPPLNIAQSGRYNGEATLYLAIKALREAQKRGAT